MVERAGHHTRNRAIEAAADVLVYVAGGNRDAAIACAQRSQALFELAATEDMLADALRVGLEECDRLRDEFDAERAVSASLREQLARLSGAMTASREPREYTPPRYDEVFFEGAAAAEAEVRAGSDMAELARWLRGMADAVDVPRGPGALAGPR